ncbi:RIB43A-like with coiled-coils protein 2 isoform X2 [Peromyscus californicus insignis]|uniref:RIB43A-like with coiled-coils protein 2 isoform X2 n=1 Tax=Peromyscus californicus insignis TaxID=564181 RepID=UPI0022A7D00F|nr:RIB43A-like with coiled-coils protein 2 isoform X2 [Peromyscus californicus insignis]
MPDSKTMEVAMLQDLRQDANLAKRRYMELCRQGRVFDARNRIIGGDTQAWDVQVRDQKIKEATEKARDETFAAEMRHNDKVMCILHDRERRDKKQLCCAINDFQQSFQKPETRREFDLSDPLALKKDLPARVSDCDMRNTISGMQKFMGEDLNFLERKRFQEEQNREWSLQQHREWERAWADHKLAEEHHLQTRLKFDETARDLQKLEGLTRKEVCAAMKEFNKNQRLQEEERQRIMDWDRRRIQKARASLLQERQQQRLQRELRRALDCSNLSLAREQYLQKKRMDEASSSQPTEDYFSQFNTRSR